MRRPESPISIHEVQHANRDYLTTILWAEALCQRLGLDHRFVGGTLTDFLGPQTEWDIDFENSTVRLRNYNAPEMFRSDGTPKDVDIISIKADPLKVEDARKEIAAEKLTAREHGNWFPDDVKIEASKQKGRSRMSLLRQLTSGLDIYQIDDADVLFLTLDIIKERTDWEAVKPWKIVLTEHGNATFTTLNPYAHALRYKMRVPSGIKKKDTDKIALMMRLGEDVVKEAQAQGVDLKQLYQPWERFVWRMNNNTLDRMKTKRTITGTFWGTIGTDMAHGKGILKPFSKYSGIFNR